MISIEKIPLRTLFLWLLFDWFIRGALISFFLPRNLALLKEVKRSRNFETTRVKDKTEVATFSTTSPYTPAKSGAGEEVTNEEVESLINHSRDVLSSDYKNTNLGDTRSKRSPENANEPSDVENSLVDSTIEGHQDGNKSKQDSPVSVKDTPGEAAPSKCPPDIVDATDWRLNSRVSSTSSQLGLIRTGRE